MVDFLQITDVEALAKAIREARKEQQITQTDLAGLAQTGLRFIVDLEKGKASCELAKVLSVINALGLKLYLK